MIVGGYSMHLYCENERTDGNHHRSNVDGNCYLSYWTPNTGYNDVKYEFTGETFMQCVRGARRYGWLIDVKERTAYCPFCNPKKKRAEARQRLMKGK